MEQIIKILHSQHDPTQLVCACDNFIKEISKNNRGYKTKNNGFDALEVGNCFMVIFLSNLNKNSILSAVVNAMIELIKRYPILKKEYCKKGIHFNIVDLIRTRKLSSSFEEVDADCNDDTTHLLCALKLATELTKHSEVNFVSAVQAGIFNLITASFLETDYGVKLACTDLLVVLLSFGSDINRENPEIYENYEQFLNQCLSVKINSESLLSHVIATLNQFIKEPVEIHINCLICILKFCNKDKSLTSHAGAIDSLLNACSQHSSNVNVILHVFQILNTMLPNYRVDDIISKLDYITDVAMQAILNHLENEEVVYTISSTLKVTVESDTLLYHILFEKGAFKFICFTLKHYYRKHATCPANTMVLEVCKCLSASLMKMMEMSNIQSKKDAMYRACSKDNIDQVLLFIYFGVDLNFVSQNEESPLYAACQRDNVFLVQQIVCLAILLQHAGVLKSRIDKVSPSLQTCPPDSKIIPLLLWYLLHRDDNSVAEWDRGGLKELNIEYLELALSKVENRTLYCDLCETVAFKLCAMIFKNRALDNQGNGLFSFSKTFYGQFVSILENENVNKNGSSNNNNIEIDNLNNSILCSYCNDPKLSFKKYLRLSFSMNDDDDENLCGCYINFPPKVEAKQITEINLSHNQICDLLPFSKLNNEVDTVKRLNLADNLVVEFPMSVARKFFNLQELNLSSNSIALFPFHIFCACKSLVKLDLSDNRLLSYTEKDILPLKGRQFSLKFLNLSNNKLSFFPAWIFSHLPHLSNLNLENNEILKLLPKSQLVGDHAAKQHCSLVELKVFSMKGNQLKFLKDFLELMPNAEIVDFSENLIEVIEEDVDTLKYAGLKSLNLSFNLLYVIPTMIKYLPKLQTLILSNNAIWTIDEFTDLATVRLQHIDISNNHISDVDTLFTALHDRWNLSIKVVILSHNNIVKLPSTIGKLEKLNTLDISHNKLEKLPDEIGKLSNLIKLDIKENKLNLEPSILNGSTNEIRRFLYARLKNSVPHNQVKLIFVGNPMAGKTTLLHTLKVASFRTRTFSGSFLPKLLSTPENKPRFATVGVDVVDLVIKHGLSTYNISAWDFAGQEDFYATHPCFLSDRAMYIAVYDASKGPAEIHSLKPWLSAIQSRASRCPVLIVGTHIDCVAKESKDDLSRSLDTELTKVSRLPWFPKGALKSNQISHELLDAKELSFYNMTLLKKRIIEIISDTTIQDVPLVGGMVPYSFIQLENLLKEEAARRDKFPVINFHELESLTRSGNSETALFESAADLMLAVKHLHQTGSLLHFNDPRSKLGDCFFIKPHWLCQLLAKVITLEDDKSFKVFPFVTKDGILSKQIFLQTFGSNQNENNLIPAEFLPRLLRLLENFEILLWQGGDVYLVPSKLPVKKPDLPQFKDVIVRYFSMMYLPMGFWPRLIARILSFAGQLLQGYSLSLGQSQKSPKTLKSWKSGMYLNWENTNDKQYVIIQSGSMNYEEIMGIRKVNVSKSSTRIDDFEHVQHTELLEKGEGLEVIVPSNQSGKILLGQVVDHLNNLVEEWYPGLLDCDQFGKPMLLQYTPCPICVELTEIENVHSFCINFLAESTMSIGSPLTEPYTVKIDGDGNLLTFCSNHLTKPVPISLFAPDVSVDDFDAKLRLDHTKLEFYPSPQSLLGDGGFGSVYHAFYKSEDIAVKTFHNVRSGTSYKMLRVELNVLAQHQHPSIISVKGFIPFPIPGKPHIQAPLLAIEYAKLGSLGQLLRDMTRMNTDARLLALSMDLRHRIIFEIADGLAFLHSKYIVYRDLKPDNVLLMSLDPNSTIIIKLTDYGVSTLASPSGVHGASGTPGYCAPEVVSLKFRGGSVFNTREKIYSKNESSEFFRYSVQCDIYSFGLLVHEVATGRSPWIDHLNEGDKTLGNSLASMDPDHIIMEGIKPAPLSSLAGVEPWPSCQLLIEYSLKRNPEERPTSKEIAQFISNMGFSALKLSCDIHENEIDFIVYCGKLQKASSTNHLINAFCSTHSANGCNEIIHCVFDIMKGHLTNEEIYITMGKDLEITTMVLIPIDVTSRIVDENLIMSNWGYPIIVLGTKQGKVIVCCDGVYHSKQLSCAITNIIFKESTLGARSNNNYLIVGLENSTIAFFTIEQILDEYNLHPLHEVNLSTFSPDPVSSLAACGNVNAFAACGKHIISLSVADSGTPFVCGTRIIGGEKSKTEFKFYHIASTSKNIYAFNKEGSSIYYWRTDKSSYVAGYIDVISEITTHSNSHISQEDLKITCMFVNDKQSELWVGTSQGHVVIFNEPRMLHGSKQKHSVSLFHEFNESVHSLSSVKIGNTDYIIALGLGNRILLNCKNDSNHNDKVSKPNIKFISCVKIWDAKLHMLALKYNDIEEQRKNVNSSYS